MQNKLEDIISNNTHKNTFPGIFVRSSIEADRGSFDSNSAQSNYYSDVRCEPLFLQWVTAPLAVGYLRLHMEEEYSSENMNFLIAVGDLRNQFEK